MLFRSAHAPENILRKRACSATIQGLFRPRFFLQETGTSTSPDRPQETQLLAPEQRANGSKRPRALRQTRRARKKESLRHVPDAGRDEAKNPTSSPLCGGPKGKASAAIPERIAFVQKEVRLCPVVPGEARNPLSMRCATANSRFLGTAGQGRLPRLGMTREDQERSHG